MNTPRAKRESVRITKNKNGPDFLTATTLSKRALKYFVAFRVKGRKKEYATQLDGMPMVPGKYG